MEFKDDNKWKEGNIYSIDQEKLYRLKENILHRVTDEEDLEEEIKVDLNKDRPKEWLNMFLMCTELTPNNYVK